MKKAFPQTLTIHDSPVLSVIYSVNIDTILNNNDVNNGHELKTLHVKKALLVIWELLCLSDRQTYQKHVHTQPHNHLSQLALGTH